MRQSANFGVSRTAIAFPQSPMIASNRANAGNRNAYALQSKQCRNNCGVLTKEGQQ